MTQEELLAKIEVIANDPKAGAAYFADAMKSAVQRHAPSADNTTCTKCETAYPCHAISVIMMVLS